MLQCFVCSPIPKVSEKKGATGQSFIWKEITTYRIGTLILWSSAFVNMKTCSKGDIIKNLYPFWGYVYNSKCQSVTDNLWAIFWSFLAWLYFSLKKFISVQDIHIPIDIWQIDIWIIKKDITIMMGVIYLGSVLVGCQNIGR